VRVKTNRMDSFEEESQEEESSPEWPAAGQASSFADANELADQKISPTPLTVPDTLHRVRLLFRQITNHRQLIHLAAVGLHQQNDPDHDATDGQCHPQQKRN